MEQPSLKRNYFYRMFYDILQIMTPFITAPYISRVLGADGIGIYSYTSSIMTYFVLFGALGTVTYGAREISRHRKNIYQVSKLFWEIELMTIMTSGISLIVWGGFIFLGGAYSSYYLALTPVLLGTMFDISWLFTGYEQIKYIVIRNSLVKILGIILIFIFVKSKADLLIYFSINSVTVLIGNLTMWLYVPKLVVRIDFRTLKFRKHLKETLIYFVPTIATSIYTVLDKTLIGLITTDNFQNGYYEQATKIVNIMKTLVFSSINAVMGTRISYLFSEKCYKEIQEKVLKSMNYILFLGVGSLFGMCGVASNFVPLFFGKEFEPVTKLLYMMSPLILIVGVSNCLGSQYYTPSGKRAKSTKFIIIGSVINLCLNICMIPKLGVYGAVFASIIAETTITVLYLKNCEGYITFKIIMMLLWKKLLAGIFMFYGVRKIGIYLPINSIFTLIIQIMTGGIIYLVMLGLMRDEFVSQVFCLIKKK